MGEIDCNVSIKKAIFMPLSPDHLPAVFSGGFFTPKLSVSNFKRGSNTFIFKEHY
jgi:hypothetical protein